MLKPISLDHEDSFTGEYGDDSHAQVTMCHYREVQVPNDKPDDRMALRLVGALIQGVARVNRERTQQFVRDAPTELDQLS